MSNTYQNDYTNDFTQAKTSDKSGRLQADVATYNVASPSTPYNVTAASPAALNLTGTESASMHSYPTFPNPDRFTEERNNRYIL
jgi:hypothetical protein